MLINGRIEAIWGTPILDAGFTPIPNLILRNYRRLGIEHGEWGFLCILFSFKHSAEDPYPSQEEISDILCCGRRQLYKWTQSLIDKGLMRVGQRYHNGVFSHNVYDFKLLVDSCLKLEGEKPLPDGIKDKIRWRNTSDPHGHTQSELQGPTRIDPEVPTEIDHQVTSIDLQDPINRTSNRSNTHSTPYNKKVVYPQDRFGSWLQLKRVSMSIEQVEASLLAYEWARSHGIDDVSVIWGTGRVLDRGAPDSTRQYYRAVVEEIEEDATRRSKMQRKNI